MKSWIVGVVAAGMLIGCLEGPAGKDGKNGVDASTSDALGTASITQDSTYKSIASIQVYRDTLTLDTIKADTSYPGCVDSKACAASRSAMAGTLSKGYTLRSPGGNTCCFDGKTLKVSYVDYRQFTDTLLYTTRDSVAPTAEMAALRYPHQAQVVLVCPTATIIRTGNQQAPFKTYLAGTPFTATSPFVDDTLMADGYHIRRIKFGVGQTVFAPLSGFCRYTINLN